MTHFLSILIHFYRRFLWISMLLNLLLFFFGFSMAIAVGFKLMLSLLLFWSYAVAGKGKAMIFYNNLGWSSKKLFLIAFLLDALLLISIYGILNHLL